MSQQGGRTTGHEDDDWWGQLYDDSTEDTGPTPATDSLDDRFASAAGTVRSASTAGDTGGAGEGVGTGAAGSVPGPRPEPPGPDGGRTDWWTSQDAPPTASPPTAPEGTVPRPRGGRAPDVTPGTHPPERHRAPWEPPSDTPPDPTNVPSGPLPPGFAERAPHGPAPSATGDHTPTKPPPAASKPPAPPSPPAPSTPPPTPPPPSPLPPPPALPPRPTPKDYVGSGPPTYDAQPTALPLADPDDLDDLVADTVLDGARYGAFALRAVSVRGDSARYRGEPRRDSLLTARFGTGDDALILVAMATGARATPGAHRAAAEVCRWIGRAVGRSHVRLAQDIRAARRGDLKSGLHRLTDRSLGRLRAGAAEQGLEPDEYAATLRCLLLPADPACRTRVFFGVGAGGLFRLRGGVWRDIEPRVGEVAGEPVVGFGSLPAETPEGDRLTMDLGITTPPNPYDPDPDPEPPREPFRFRASVARPGDTLLMCTGGLAEPLRGEPDLSAHLTGRWSGPTPPALAAFLADTQVRVKGYADDRTAAAVWEA
ncbi:protein phosphatase 2C domain-containing protein [Streptomyces sp. NBC_01485]|uniref:PP2C family serine/threonine-protein phosphatase n=1 Tax=Streptomyces sp. NBC_01485 TaxID=2903884 RepID=UPI002E35C7AE|nr:PP2C family serine/threonine-protein phosphatase [Streptomyces sp. NBC_01485]